MKYKVEGTMYYEGIVEIDDPEQAAKDFSEVIFKTDAKGLAGHLITNMVAREFSESDIEGLYPDTFRLIEGDTWFDDPEVEEVEG